MSPASKSKSKGGKPAPKAGKEQSKVSMKPSAAHSNFSNGSPATSSYNPVMGTFHTIEISSSSFSEPQSNGRFRTIDDTDDHSGSSQSTITEYDSLSNNGSCSGESEDQKDKPTSSPLQTETIPGSDNDKRGKTRQKNERKHQRQKEKRAQELHERCISFLTSRKLEALSHQLVSMGFASDRATMAIIVNEGRMEESVSWLLHEGEDDNKQQVSVNLQDKNCIKIDITDELARIAKMAVQHKSSRQDVERAVVSCEGDLLKAEENLKLQKLALSAAMTVTPTKSDESADSMERNDKNETTHRSPILTASAMKAVTQQQRREDRDSKHSKTLAPGTPPQGSMNKNLHQSLKRILPKPTADWSVTQAASFDKRWPTIGAPVSLASHVQVSAKLDSRFKAAARAMKEPIIVMQRPKQKPPSSNTGTSVSLPTAASTGMRKNVSTAHQFTPEINLQSTPSVPAELAASAGWRGHSWNASGTISPPLATPSLGLYAGLGSSCSSMSSSHIDWNTGGSTPLRDYTSIDWSLDPTPRQPTMKIDIVSDTWSTMFMGGNATRPRVNGGGGNATRPRGNGGGAHLPGLHELTNITSDYSAPSSSSQDWTSPFEGRDLFRVPRQYVTSPSM